MQRLQFKHLKGLALSWQLQAEQYKDVEDNEFVKGSMLALLSCFSELERLYMEDPVSLEMMEQNFNVLNTKSKEGLIMGIRTRDFEKDPQPPKTYGELRKWLETVSSEFDNHPITIQQENDVHYIHYMEQCSEQMFYHPDGKDLDLGSMPRKEWEEHYAELDLSLLVPSIPEGAPMLFEDF